LDTLRILVVDDEPGMRTGVARALTDARFNVPEVNGEIGYSVETAESGEEALEKIHAARPDILLLDHRLPGMSGLDVLDHIQAHQDQMLTVMITAYASLETAVTAIKRGAYDFLAKPFTPAELKVTVRKAAESLVLARRARELAQEKRQVRFQFISVLAHELKAPLAAVEGYLDIIKNRTLGDEMGVYDGMLDRCLMRVGAMRKQIVDLLDLTRIESGQKQRELAPTDVRQAAQAAIETFAPEALQNTVGLYLKAGPAVMMTADRSELEIMFNNLISNAIKYNREHGRVDVSVAAEEGQVKIVVADTGVGMTEEESAKLFHDFVRIKNARTRDILGSGLGLSIVKKLLDLYGGRVQVTSQPDVGTTFTVWLPQAPPAAGESRQPVGAEAAAPGATPAKN
jgi:two-component system, sensor histidine kinase and response regulator